MVHIKNIVALPGRLVRLARDLRAAAIQYDANYLRIVLRAMRLFMQRGFFPREALIGGLLDPRVPADVEAACISRRRLFAHQRRYNPQTSECLTEDKAVFYAYCSAFGLPVPAHYAVFDVPNGWSSTGEILRDRRDWERFFREHLPKEFVVKPAAGVYGQGVNVYKRTAAGFLDASGTERTASALYETLRSDDRYRRFVIQERLRSHPDLERLSGTAALQTARLVTWVRSDGEVEIYRMALKIIAGGGVTDNYEDGRTGNLIANIGIEEGTLEPAIGGGPNGIGFRVVREHPKTGVAFSGFHVPYWQEARRLVSRAASLFWPIRTIGWDVAFTPDGPVLIEGNMWWDPPSDALAMGPQAANDRRRFATLLKRFETEAHP